MALSGLVRRLLGTAMVSLDAAKALADAVDAATPGGATLTATNAELINVADISAREVDWTVAGAVTAAAHSGKTVGINNTTGFATTLPAATGSGAKYRFVIKATVASGNHTIVATGAHLFGNCFTISDNSAAVLGYKANGATTITMDGSTRGGIKGDVIEIEDVATNVLIVRMTVAGTGSEATPFS